MAEEGESGRLEITGLIRTSVMTDTTAAALIGALVGSAVSIIGSFITGFVLLRRQQAFQDEMFEKQRKHEEVMQQRQHRHDDDMARERRNYEKTGIASMKKVGGG
jgi:mannitol-specific phosphotransferase system IIBC component